MNIAVILAGGAGNRMNTQLPKQYLEVAGRQVIVYSIDAFEQNSGIDEIAVVVNPTYRNLFETIAANYNWTKVRQLLNGGAERSSSTLAALQAYANVAEANILFHDAARPLVSQRIINDMLAALNHYDAATVAILSPDTILQTDDTQTVVAQILPRQLLRRVQTPQGFRLSIIRKAYELAADDPHFAATDDCGVVFNYFPEIKIGLVEGDEANFKITYPEDIQRMESLRR